jgi:hypothetical protein
LTVALTLLPEAVFVAGVHPLVGLDAAFLVGLITAPLAVISIVAFVVIATRMEVPGVGDLAWIEGAKVYQVRTGILGGH